tara:strand:- start:3138 stop:4721 length:1584 start_codon:yes stop_codon:yes gene_type:complete
MSKKRTTKLSNRNRVIYQSEALFISPDATGKHIYYMPASNAGLIDKANYPNAPLGREQYRSECWISGSGDGGQTFVFDACVGTGDNPGKTEVIDYKNRMYKCTGVDSAGNEVTLAKHAVLSDVGMKSGVSGGGLKYIQNEDLTSTSGSWGTAIEQLKRIQSANYSFTVNRTDVNQFGQLGRIDAIVNESPVVNLDFSYYITDGENERLLGFVTHGQKEHLSGIMVKEQNEFGHNMFILTVPEGRDAVKGDTMVAEDRKSVISIGNAFITDYSIEASVGGMPTVSVTMEGLNIKSDVGGTDFREIPAINPQDGTQICDTCFVLPPSESGFGVPCLKAGDIHLDLNGRALISKQISGDTRDYSEGSDDRGSAHIQSFTLSAPLARESLNRMGNTYAFAKEIEYPVTATLTVNALVSDIKAGNLADEIYCGNMVDLKIRMQNPMCIRCTPNNQPDGITIDFKGAYLESEGFTSAIGENKSVDLTFVTQITGPEEDDKGIFFSGFANVKGEDGKYKEPPSISPRFGKLDGS